MSALGQKQTFAPQKVMSALPPKTNICSALDYVSFGLEAGMHITPAKRTYSGARALSSGTFEILIRPLNGSFSSKIK